MLNMAVNGCQASRLKESITFWLRHCPFYFSTVCAKTLAGLAWVFLFLFTMIWAKEATFLYHWYLNDLIWLLTNRLHFLSTQVYFYSCLDKIKLPEGITKIAAKWIDLPQRDFNSCKYMHSNSGSYSK